MPTGLTPATLRAPTRLSTVSRRAATTTTSICPLRTKLCVRFEHLPVEDGVLERHRDVVLSLKSDCGLELAAIGDRGQAKGSDDHALVGDPDPHSPRKLVLGEELLDRLAERLLIGDLAVLSDARGEGANPRFADRDAAVDAHLGGGDAVRLDVEADRVGC